MKKDFYFYGLTACFTFFIFLWILFGVRTDLMNVWWALLWLFLGLSTFVLSLINIKTEQDKIIPYAALFSSSIFLLLMLIGFAGVL